MSGAEFSRRAAAYAAGRPQWSDQFMEYVAARAGIEPHHSIVEFGAGTGNSANWLVNNGNTFYGVDPSTNMRTQAQTRFAGKPNFKSIQGNAREPNLDGVRADFILVAQALHWWAGEKEEVLEVWRQLLKSEGKLVVLSYNPDAQNPLVQEIHTFFSENWPRYNKSETGLINAPKLSAGNAHFYIDPDKEPVHETGLAMCVINPDLDHFMKLMFSYSFAPPPGTMEAEALYPGLEAIHGHYQKNGKVRIPYLAEMVIGSLARGPA